ncbi:MAG: malate dehydrogenase [Sulfurovum sp.]|nr:malate dehydrogenase [Sulfurovum sp.]
MKKRKVGIVGAGAVGATAAFALTMTGSCRKIILYDINPDIAIGKAIDIAQAAPYSPQGTIIEAAESACDMQDCDIVVITAGVPRKGDMTRENLLMINAKIITEVVDNIKKYSPNAIVICVANPLDVMTYAIHRLTGWDRNRIIGMAGALDGARMAYQIHKKVGFGSGQVRAVVIGDHGENMIPYPEIAAVGGVPLDQLLSKTDIEEVIEKTKIGGAEIVKHLKTSGYYAPGRAVAVMVEAILDDSRIVLPSSVMLEGEYGHSDVTVGVPVVLGSSGVERIIELELNENTKAKLKLSVDTIKAGIKVLEENGIFT